MPMSAAVRRRKTSSSSPSTNRAPAPSRPVEQTDQSGGHDVKSMSQPEESKSNTSSGVKRDARAAELPDEDEEGGKFQQVEGLTAVDAEEIPCEFSVEDDFLIDENAEGVDEKNSQSHRGQREERARRDGRVHTLMQTGVEIHSSERVPQVECSRWGQQHCESSRRVRVVKRCRAERASTTLR